MTIRTMHYRQNLIRTRGRGSEGSLASSIEREQAKEPRALRSSSRAVRFCEERNKVYANVHMTKDQCHETWYSAVEMKMFKVETALLAKKIIKSTHSKHDQWKKTLLTAYAGLAKSKTVTDIQELLDTCHMPAIDPILLGLEKWVLNPIVQDKALRRKQLVGAVYACHDDKTSSLSQKTKNLRKFSREISRTSRLFAHHVALSVACGQQ